MRRLSAGGVPLLLMCCFLNAVLYPFSLPGRAAAVSTTSTPSPATQKSVSDKLAGDRAATLEGSLLNMFGLKRRPRPRLESVVIPEFLIELYKQQTGLEVDTTSFNLRGKLTQTANTVRTFLHEENEDDSRFPLNTIRLKFDLTNIPSNEDLKAAELRLYRSTERVYPVEEVEDSSAESMKKVRENKRRKQQIFVHEVLRPGNKKKGLEPLLRLLDTRVVDSRDEGWETFDVLPALLRWREKPNHNYGLLIQIRKVEDQSLADVEHFHLRRPKRRRRSEDSTLSERRWLNQQPLLVTYTDDGKARSRSKRAAEKKHKRKGRRDNCRRHPLYVDFSDVGWNDWIVAPPGYHAFYCQGECPFPLPDHLNTTNHAIVQTLVHSVNPGVVPRVCCVPTELSPISMLYIDEYDKVVLKNYHEMVVEACGCR